MSVKVWPALFLITLTFPALARASGKLEFSTESALAGKYVWRGIVLTDGAVFQPSVTAAYGGLSFNVWSNLDLDNVNSKDYRFNEIDYTLDYTLNIQNYGLSLGSIVYDFPNTGYPATHEIYLGISQQSFLNPSLTLYRDIDEASGSYLRLGFGHSIQLTKAANSLDLAAGLGYGSAGHNRFYYHSGRATVTNLLLGVSLPVTARENLNIVPGLYYSSLLDGAIRAAAAKADNLIFSLAVSAAF